VTVSFVRTGCAVFAGVIFTGLRIVFMEGYVDVQRVVVIPTVLITEKLARVRFAIVIARTRH